MILKIQVSLNGTGKALVYNQTRTLQQEFPASLVEVIMKGRPKAYFFGEVIHDELCIDGEAPSQEW